MSVNTTTSFEGGIIRKSSNQLIPQSSPPSESQTNVSSTQDTADSDLLEPTERTGLLSPDDPIVSPLNLSTIKLLRQLTYYLLIFNTIVLIFLILSHFITFSITPYFRDINLLILCIIYNVTTLWCFVVTGISEIYLSVFTIVLVLIDMLVILFKLSGVWSPLYTIINLVYFLWVESYIRKCKTQQEIKYTGRPETRMTVFEIFISSIKFFIKLATLILVLMMSMFVWLNAFDTKVTGKTVNINGVNLHLECYGSKNGTVLVEGGLKTSSESYLWVEDMFKTNLIPGYCVYDRPGYGISDYAPTTVSLATEYLVMALKEEEISDVVVVAYDIGGLYSQVLTTHGIVKGLMLIDSWHPDLLQLNYPFKEKFDVVEVPSAWNGFKLWCKGILSPLGLRPLSHLIHPKLYNSWARVFGDDMIYNEKYLLTRLQNHLTTKWSSNEIPSSSDVKTLVISRKSKLKSKNWSNWQRELTKWGKCVDWKVIDDNDKYSEADSLKFFLEELK